MGTQLVMTPNRRRASMVLAALSFLVVIACVSRWRRNVPVQGWWDEHGPVVPHDSFPADCSLCHQGEGWTEIREDFEFDHAQETGVPLIAAHAEAQCLRCHNDRGPVAMFASRGCAGCHEDVHRGEMGADCEVCHDQENWRPDEVIEIHARTRFPLIGAHAAAACWRCHPGGQSGNFSPVSAECATCHQADLALALDPNHIAQGWVSDCDECHIPTTWDGAGFTHTTWPLTGAHRTTDCTECHIGGVFAGTPTECVDCHLPDYLGATDPDHDAMGFPTDCALCHNTSDWDDAQFDHAGILTGCANCHLPDFLATSDPDHQAQGYSTSCEDCHTTSSWSFNHAGIVTNCVDCHLPDYQGTTDPDHQAQGFSLNCEECHSTSSWTFNHGGISTGCVDCHLPDYQATTDPNHTVAGFPTTCELCHNTTNWNDADFNHTFPIGSGTHSIFDCNDCHLSPATFSDPSCTHCHDHLCAEMTSKHNEVGGFVCISSACIECHPNGKAD